MRMLVALGSHRSVILFVLLVHHSKILNLAAGPG